MSRRQTVIITPVTERLIRSKVSNGKLIMMPKISTDALPLLTPYTRKKTVTNNSVGKEVQEKIDEMLSPIRIK